jgi:hypothetical protein
MTISYSAQRKTLLSRLVVAGTVLTLLAGSGASALAHGHPPRYPSRTPAHRTRVIRGMVVGATMSGTSLTVRLASGGRVVVQLQPRTRLALVWVGTVAALKQAWGAHRIAVKAVVHPVHGQLVASAVTSHLEPTSRSPEKSGGHRRRTREAANRGAHRPGHHRPKTDH